MSKFISLLANEALYFACQNQFKDPYEGCSPKSYYKNTFGPIINYASESCITFKQEGKDTSRLESLIREFPNTIKELHEKGRSQFGINCWYQSEYESDAMWKLYSAGDQCIAVESTIEQLKSSIVETVTYGSVRYYDFENDEFPEDREQNLLFSKRRAFEHEKEYRATVALTNEEEGVLIKCCLNTLITAIHISPSSPMFLKNDIQTLLNKLAIDKPVLFSSLFTEPNYQGIF